MMAASEKMGSFMVIKPCMQVTFVGVSPDDKLLNEKEQKK